MVGKGNEKSRIIRLGPLDNVVVALSDLYPGDEIEGFGLVRDPVPVGHKAAAADIPLGAPVFKYGQVIGFAGRDIALGAHVHTHNVILKNIDRDYAFGTDLRPEERTPEPDRAFFEGLVRPDGRVGTRNYIGILPTVNCSAGVARFIASRFTPDIMVRYPMVDGVVALTHGSGCCDEGEGQDLLERTMAGYADHPNFGGVLLVGLGCEINLVENIRPRMKNPGRPAAVIQDLGGTENTIRAGVADVYRLLEQADQTRRTKVGAERLMLGLECGGSDAWSGLSANPVLGRAVDRLVSQGGTAVLSETPEIYGAEHLLTRRAVRPDVGEKLVRRIRWWEEYVARHGSQINNNPSPGNKAGGITTIFEKSLGALAKAGQANLTDVYGYAEPVTAKGLVFMDTPGYDPVSITGMIAGGANLVCFTTGRGSVFGAKPVPILKLASNSRLFHQMPGDMDLNAGLIIDGRQTIDEMGRTLFQLILDTASGRKTRSEIQGFGDVEFVPWHLGAVL